MKWLAALVLLSSPLKAEDMPRRVASLDLCSDELVLALAAPGRIASVSKLGADPRETALAQRAAGLPTNNGRITDVAAVAPDLVVTMGGLGGRLAAATAARLGAKVLLLPAPAGIADVRTNVRLVAGALGRPAAGRALIAAMDRQLGPRPSQLAPALLVGSGGVAPPANGLAAQWLAYAGLRQVAAGDPVRLETLIADPPPLIVETRYHAGDTSLGALWLQHPALRRLPSRHIAIDGRAWTCLGPQTAASVAALRRSLG